MNLKVPGILVVLLLILMAIQAACFHPRMPERLGTQFDREGNARTWMGRGAFLAVYAGMAVFLGAIALLVPLASNDPGTGRERAAGSRPPLTGKRILVIKAAVMWAVAGIIALLLGAGHFTFRANLGESAPFRARMDLLLIGFGVYMAVWMVLFLRALGSGRSSQE